MKIPVQVPRPAVLIRQLRELLGRRRRSAICRELALHAVGTDRLLELKRLYRKHGRDLERRLEEMLQQVAGRARERLSRLAVDLGVVARWQQQARSRKTKLRKQALARLIQLSPGMADSTLLMALVDPEESVRVEAARALLRSGGPHDVETVFTFAISQPRSIRLALAEDLCPHALTLCENAMPEALGSRDPERLKAALDLVESWGKALLLPQVFPLLHHRDPEVQARAFRALPLVAALRDFEPEILRALGTEDQAVKAAACHAAARLRMAAALPAVARCLCDSNADLAWAAACGLAEMGPAGWKVLEAELRSAWQPGAAAAAVRALDRLKTTHFGYARL
jgi:hypothetical protein